MAKSDLLFLGIVATIPIQLSKFFWPDFSYVLGIPVDYQAITFYASDLFIFAYLILFTLEHARKLPQILADRKILVASLALFNLYLAISALLISPSKAVSLYSSLRVFQFSLLALFAQITLSSNRLSNLSQKLLLFSAFWQSSVVILQFIFQKSLGLWILGERSFDSTTTGIAHTGLMGSQLLRPYGTFPHPNVVGAFLVITLLVSLPTWHRTTARIPALSTVIVALLAAILTFSKTAILALGTSLLVAVGKVGYILLGLSLLILLVIVGPTLLPDGQLASVAERLILAQAAFDITLKNPLFGVGSGNFIAELARLNLFSLSEVRLLQPVHNVFLLILAESGIAGLLLFALFLAVVAKRVDSSQKLVLFMVILIYASTDHFFWTLHQGRLLFWLAIAFILSSPKTENSAKSVNRKAQLLSNRR